MTQNQIEAATSHSCVVGTKPIQAACWVLAHRRHPLSIVPPSTTDDSGIGLDDEVRRREAWLSHVTSRRHTDFPPPFPRMTCRDR